MKFACPACGQHLEGDAGYGGLTLNCPACNRPFTVPGAAPRPAYSWPASTSARAPAAAAAPPARAAAPIAPLKPAAPLAIWSFALSVASLVIGPLGFIPGIICGHLAKRAMRRDPGLAGRGLATAGLAVGYTFLLLFLAVAGFFIGTGIYAVRQLATMQPPVSQGRVSVGSAPLPAAPAYQPGAAGPGAEPPGARPWTINVSALTIPTQPAQGRIGGEPFVVRRARLVGQDLWLSGSPTEELPELRLSGRQAGHSMMSFTVPGLVTNAARSSVASLILPNGSVSAHFEVTFRTAKGETKLTDQAGLYLVMHRPRDGRCPTAICLGLGESSKDYLIGQFDLELPADLAETVKDLKPFGTTSDFGNRKKERGPQKAPGTGSTPH
ncbi:MAG: DUF4190 domain-containing protein [Verrucomicrobiota bacterium]